MSSQNLTSFPFVNEKYKNRKFFASLEFDIFRVKLKFAFRIWLSTPVTWNFTNIFTLNWYFDQDSNWLLFQTVEVERKSREERHKACIETSQEVRMAREQEQKIAREYQVEKRLYKFDF